MKKSFQLIYLAFVGLIIGSGLRLMYILPVDTQPYVEKKYAGWNGVLQAWICADWEPGGSFIRWLNDCASDFEKAHEGVYLEFTPVSINTIRALDDSDIRKPELIFFSPAVISNPNLFIPLQAPDELRNDLKSYGQNRSLPVAISGYIWAYNTSLCNSVPVNADEVSALTIPTNQRGYFYSAALLGLLSSISGNDIDQPTLPDSGIDLGLPVSAVDPIFFSDQAMDSFINGNLPCIPVCSNDIDRLSRLRDSGKGPDWMTSASGSIACTDQLLMGGIPEQYNGCEQGRLAEEFLLFLLGKEAQAQLADIGAHSVIGEKIYSDFSVYAELDALLNSRPLWLPDCFSEYSVAGAEAIVRGFLNKDFSAKEALSLLGFESM